VSILAEMTKNNKTAVKNSLDCLLIFYNSQTHLFYKKLFISLFIKIECSSPLLSFFS